FEQAPLFVERGRYFYASTQYFSLEVKGRKAMTAALVPHEGDETPLEGMRLLLAVQQGDTFVSRTLLVPVDGGAQAIDTDGAFRIVVAVINTARQGSSRRPSLCVGTVEEVAACRAAIVPAPDAGTPDEPDAGSAPGEPPDDEAAGCGCGRGGGPALVALALLPVFARRPGRRQG
ncbi:MAG: hypothetical protein ACK4N5_21235, partial [Myxococcales bacterium]